MTRGISRRFAVPSAVLRFHRFRWSGVAPETYKQELESTWAGMSRHVLIAGSRGAPIAFDLRYFEVEPGGYSALETHAHAHVIVAVRGKGRLRVGRQWHTLQPLDACYVAPRAMHQLRNESRKPFGFFCLVDAER